MFCYLIRLTTRPERDEFSESVAEFMQRNRLKIDLKLQPCRPAAAAIRSGAPGGGVVTPSGCEGGGKLLQTPCTEFVAKELRTPEVDGVYAVSLKKVKSYYNYNKTTTYMKKQKAFFGFFQF